MALPSPDFRQYQQRALIDGSWERAKRGKPHGAEFSSNSQHGQDNLFEGTANDGNKQVAALMLALTSTVALVAVKYGTSDNNLQSTSTGDALYGYGSDDRIYGDDLIKGGPGHDDPGFDVGSAARTI